MNRVTLFGAAYSVYVRIVRLVLAEIGVPYELVEIDVFAKEGVPADYLQRHPFGRIPALEHDGFRLFETDAIVGYIVDQFGGDALLPADEGPGSHAPDHADHGLTAIGRWSGESTWRRWSVAALDGWSRKNWSAPRNASA